MNINVRFVCWADVVEISFWKLNFEDNKLAIRKHVSQSVGPAKSSIVGSLIYQSNTFSKLALLFCHVIGGVVG